MSRQTRSSLRVGTSRQNHHESPYVAKRKRGGSKSQTIKQGPPNKCLCLILDTNDAYSISYVVLSFKATSLFEHSDKTSSRGRADPKPRPEEVHFARIDKGEVALGMGCATWETNLYFLGGRKAEVESSESDTESPDTAPTYSPHDYSSSVFKLDRANSGKPFAFEVQNMRSGKASPLVMKVKAEAEEKPKEKLYVLAGTPVSMLPKPAFEVYDPEFNSWKSLRSPPFLKPDSMFFQDPQYRAYAVIKNKIHVSTSSSSFSFDTEKEEEEWKPCTLFDGDGGKLHRPPWMDSRYRPHLYHRDSIQEEQDGGHPFDFVGRAVVVCEDDVLICLDPSEGVKAHILEDEKVKVTQSLKGLEIKPGTKSAYLADFGEGNLCLVSVLDHEQPQKDRKSRISFTLFQVKKEKLPKQSASQRVDCTVLATFSPSYEDDFLANKAWSPIDCLVL